MKKLLTVVTLSGMLLSAVARSSDVKAYSTACGDVSLSRAIIDGEIMEVCV